MKILVAAQYYRPDITAAAFRIAETVDLLAEMGHEVTVITSEPHRAQATPTERGAPAAGTDTATAGAAARSVATGGTRTASGSDPGVVIHRVPIDPLAGSGMKPYLRHFFSFVFRARRAARRLFRSGYRPDVIWVSSPPLFVGLIGTAARRWSGAPLVLDIRDVWPDTAVAAGQLSQDGRAYAIGRRLEHWLYRKADAFSCVAVPMADYLRREIGVARGIGVAPRPDVARGTGVDEPPIAPRNGSADPAPPFIEVVYNGAGFVIPEPPPADRIGPRVLYAGNLGRLQGVDALLDAWASIAPSGRIGWTLELVGTGVMEKELREQTDRLAISDTVRFRGVLPKAETVEEMRHAGVLFLNLLARPVFDLTIPSKLFDYLATGRPIVGGITGEGASILARLPGNQTVRPNDSAEIAAALTAVIAQPGWNDPLPQNQQVVTERYSRRVNTERLAALFGRVTGR